MLLARPLKIVKQIVNKQNIIFVISANAIKQKMQCQ